MSIPPPGSGYAQAYDTAPSPTPDDKTMAMLAYILGIFTGFAGPLVLWLLKKDQSKFVAFHALQALLLHAAVTIGYILGVVTSFLLVGFFILPVVGILGLVFSILAGLAANKGDWYDIPILGPIARQQTGI